MSKVSYSRLWKSWADHSEISHYLTVTFGSAETPLTLVLSDREARKYLSYFIHLVNQRVYGRRYKELGKHLRGLVTQEYQKSGNPHFNLLLLYDPTLSTADLAFITATAACKVHKVNREGKPWRDYRSGRLVSVMSPKGVSIQPVTYARGVMKYSLKDVFSFSYLTGFLTEDGVEWDSEAEARHRHLQKLYTGE